MRERSKARQAALQIMCQIDLGHVPQEKACDLYWENLATGREGEAYANSLVQFYLSEREVIDAMIEETSLHWRLSRMSCVDRNVLRLAATELRHCMDVPARVVLNEAVELAKRFGAEGSGAFVNGVLDQVAARLNLIPSGDTDA